MFPTEVITQITDIVVVLFAVMVLFMIDVICSAKNDVVVDVSFIYMGAGNV